MAEDVDRKKVLLVEGRNDEHVTRHIWKSHDGGRTPFAISDKRGFDKLLKSIYSEYSAGEREVLGILIDANDDPDRRWKKLAREIEKELKFQIPLKPERLGTIIDRQPRVGIWMMPDNNSSGELENFIRNLIPAGDSIWPRSCGYIDEIPLDDRKFSPGKVVKAQVHAWLATLKKPSLMGAAIRKGDLDAYHPSAIKFYEWLHRLFVEN